MNKIVDFLFCFLDLLSIHINQSLYYTNDPIFSKMFQLEILRENEQRFTSLSFGRLFATKMATRRKQRR